MRVVLDANIFISSIISTEGNPAKIVDRWRAKHFDLLVSRLIVDEILRVTGYERIQKKYPKVKDLRLELVDLLTDNAVWVDPLERLAVVTADPTDNRYIECAAAGSADYIITGDQHLLDIGEYKGTLIVTPASFLKLLDLGLN